MATEQVRMWRPANEDRVLLMAGRTNSYAVEPRGEYVFGVVSGQPMRSRRGRERRLVQPGQLVAWDPSDAHSGASIDGRPWSARLMVLEVADLSAIAGDAECLPVGDIAFPEPVVSDPELSRGFVALHVALEAPSTRLERDERLAEWLRGLVRRTSVSRPAPSSSPRDDRAMRLACDYLGDHAARNVGLDELAAAAGIGKFRLIRIFRERTGLPPHALQIAHRIRHARRLLEDGETIAQVAFATGFADQSHLHRHFQRSLGLTPGAYRRHFQA
jgi:AraC-like DNA-binding protein